MSKNIDGLIDSTNVDADPYLTKEQIFDKWLFGRAYENIGDKEFVPSADASLNIYSSR